MKYIDSEKLIAEIERYKQGSAIARFDNAGENADYFQGKVDLCDDLTHIITSLQQEQPEVDLETAKKVVIELHPVMEYCTSMELGMSAMIDLVLHGYKLGLNTRKEE